MRGLLLRRQERRQRLGPDLNHGHGFNRAGTGSRSKIEPRLLRTDQPEVNVRQQLAVEERAVLGARGVVDPVAAAQRVEIVRAAGVLAPRQRQRIRHILHAERREPEAAELVIEKAHIEGRVVDDEPGIAQQFGDFVRHVADERLVREELRGQAVYIGRGLGHVALGIEIPVPEGAGGDVVDQLDASQLDDAVAVLGVEPRRLGVENKFAHWPPRSVAAVPGMQSPKTWSDSRRGFKCEAAVIPGLEMDARQYTGFESPG